VRIHSTIFLTLGAVLLISPSVVFAKKDKIDTGSAELSRLLGGNDEAVVFGQTDEPSAIENVDEGISDGALVTGSLDALIDQANQGSPEPIKKSDLTAEKVAEIAMSFVVHKDNPVKALTKKQIKDIFSGKVTNWKQLGGQDQPILLVTEGDERASHKFMRKSILDDSEIAARTREVGSSIQARELVSFSPQALGLIYTADLDESIAAVQTNAKLAQPVFLVTKAKEDKTAKRINKALKARMKK